MRWILVYRFYNQMVDVCYMTEWSSCSRIAYSSKQRMDKLYPNGDYEVIGEIGNFAKEYPRQDVIITDTGKVIPIFPKGSIRKSFEWVTGYASVGENTFVAVVRSIVPKWILRLYLKKFRRKAKV